MGYPIDDFGSLRIYTVKYPARSHPRAGDRPYGHPSPSADFSSTTSVPTFAQAQTTSKTTQTTSCSVSNMSFKSSLAGFPSLRSTISTGRLRGPHFNPQFGRAVQRTYSTYQAPRSAFRKWSTRLCMFELWDAERLLILSPVRRVPNGLSVWIGVPTEDYAPALPTIRPTTS